VWTSSVKSLRVTSTNSFMSFLLRSINLLKDVPHVDHDDLEGVAWVEDDSEGADSWSVGLGSALVLGRSLALLVAPSRGLMNW
jgi:hypothetical protein